MNVLTKVCDVCKNEFQTRSRSPERERFCSKQCNRNFWNSQKNYYQPKPAPGPKNCDVCQHIFIPTTRRPDSKTCSLECNRKRSGILKAAKKLAARDMEPRQCGLCSTMFVPTVVNWKVQKFCSPRCAKISGSRAYTKRNPGYSTKRVRQRRYDGNFEKCLERDGHKCCMCGSANKPHVHHLDCSGQTQKPNHALENLATLCSSCHTRMHDIQLRFINGQPIVSGLVFEWLKLDSVTVART